MNLSAQKIAHDILTLPNQEQQEVADFIEFLKVKLARTQAKRLITAKDQQTEGARILEALKKAELLGCMEEGDGQLSENYKQHLWDSE